MLHIPNGDATRLVLERSGVPGVFVSWPDILYEGPVPLTSDREEWRRVRVAYLTQGEDAGADALAEEYARGDAALASWIGQDETVFWFEHDLYDQLLLIHHLAFLSATGARAPHAARLSMVCGDTYLGPLQPAQFPALFAARSPITAAQLDKGTRAWTAFCSPDPSGLQRWTQEDEDLPFLAGAIRRHVEEFPAEADGLSRSERQILQVLNEGDRTPEQTFVQCARLEERIFMGDASFWTIVRRLADGPRPLVEARVDNETAPQPGRISLPGGTLRITGDGRAVLGRRADYVALNGIDRWLGGVRLTPDHLWRRTSRGDLQPAS